MKLDNTRWVLLGGFSFVGLLVVTLLIDAYNEPSFSNNNMKQEIQKLLEKTFPQGIDLVYVWTDQSSTKYLREVQRWRENEQNKLKELLENVTYFYRGYDYFRYFVRSVEKHI
jgi:chemotaxis methyl-accepting protein methylase